MTVFNYTGALQTETITASSIYQVTAAGGQGGSGGGTNGAGRVAGERGALVVGDIYLAAGAVLLVEVGGEGGGGGGGGGSTEVVETFNGTAKTDLILAVAGGGAGGGGYGGAGGGGGYTGGGGGNLGKAGVDGTSYDANLTHAAIYENNNSFYGNASVVPVCYLRGTRILTPTGEKPIESLQIGGEVVTRFRGTQKIKFLGCQSFAPQFAARNPAKCPVIISAGALASNVPRRDLAISPGHSMLIGKSLILARSLVNGITITQPIPTTQIDYIQIELEAHDCIMAEGAWSETFADGPGLRAQFHNAAAFWALYPNHQTPEALRLCTERPEAGPALEEALIPLITHATRTLTPGLLEGSIDRLTPTRIEGWAMDAAHPMLPVLLEVWLGNHLTTLILACDPRADLAAAGKGNGHHAFALNIPEPLTPAELATLSIRRRATGEALQIPLRLAA